MLTYSFFLLIPLGIALLSKGRNLTLSSSESIPFHKVLWVCTEIFFIIIIAFRYEVGGDWGPYMWQVNRFRGLPYSFTGLLLMDPGYQTLNWIGANIGGGIFFVNFVSAVLFTRGVFAFCKTLPDKWLGLALALPYLVFIVGMGYTRQGVALGLWMLALSYASKEFLTKKDLFKIIAVMVVAVLFHRTVVVPFPLLFLSRSKHIVKSLLAILPVVGVLTVIFILPVLQTLIVNYVDAEYMSRGALIRLLQGAFVGGVLFLFHRSYRTTLAHYRLYILISLIYGVSIGVYFVFPSSTVIDRLALYFLPFQVAVLAGFPKIMEGRLSVSLRYGPIILYTLLVFVVWFGFADHRSSWIPYSLPPLDYLLRFQ